MIVAIVFFYQTIRLGAFGSIPSKAELGNFQNSTASEIYSADSVLLGKYYLQERTNVDFKDISPAMIEALIATEDVRFYKHKGVDKRSWIRVMVKTILLQKETSGGGSTITQQLAKNIYPRQNHGWLSVPVNKVKEMIMAQRLEQAYAKEEILALYLNTVSFGESAFGIETAASRFFSTSPKNLEIQEAAMLVGMLKATYTYNPRLHPEAALARRNVVLRQMVKYNFLPEKSYDSLKTLPLELNYNNRTHNEGLATYFREYLRKELNLWCSQNQKSDGNNYNLYTDGLKIYTSIDSKLQQYAEEALAEHMRSLQEAFTKHWGKTRPWYKNKSTLTKAIYKSERYKKLKAEGLTEKEIQSKFREPVPMTIFSWEGEQEKTMTPLDSVKHYLYFLNAGFMAMDPRNGAVRAWVGGINHKYFKYDHVNLQTRRQVGSTFKPIVYATALENGVKPCDFIANKKITYTAFDDWTPGNADGKYEGAYSVQGALANSVNTVSVRVLKQAKIPPTVAMAHDMGITNEIPAVPSMALGVANLSLFEMVGAFCTFSNRGRPIKSQYITSIMDARGSLIQGYETPQPESQVMSSRIADLMVEMLKNVVNRGTASRLRYKYGLRNDMGGKTGTTQSHADGWFIGITPQLVGGAWVGADDPNIHFRSIGLGQGAAMALPIWAKFLEKIEEDPQHKSIIKARFRPPSEAVVSLLDCEFYRDNERTLEEIFKRILGERNRPKKKVRKRRKRRRN
ncbi:MAG: penicillin-binding protein 1A [Cyclobacteriaceae bacterium]